MKLTNSGNIFFPTNDGTWISENQQRVAEIIKDYDKNLELQWIPPGDRGPDDYAFRVVDFTPGKPPYAALFAHEADERLLARLFAADNAKNGGSLNVLDVLEDTKRLMELKSQKERNMEAHELAYSVLRSNKIHYKHNGFDFGKLGGH